MTRRKRIDVEYLPPRRKGKPRTSAAGAVQGKRKMVGVVSDDGGEGINVEFKPGEKRTSGRRGFLRRAYLFWRLLRDRGYRVSGALRVMWLLMPLYLLSPIDLIPDALLGLGFLDDLFLLMLAIGMLDGEVKRYMAYKGMQDDK